MSKIFKHGLKLLLKMLVVVFLDFFLCISISVLCIGGFTKNIGYDAFGSLDGGKSEYLYTYYEADGEDTKKAEYEGQGYTVTTNSIRSDFSGKGKAIYLTVTQILCLLVLIPFVYSPIYELGFKESNLVRFKHTQQDLLKGLKIGLLANIPFVLSYIALIVCALGALPSLPVSLYKLFNSYGYTIIELVAGNVVKAGELSAVKLVLLAIPLVAVPTIATVAYILGYKGISISEKLIYKKNKEAKD